MKVSLSSPHSVKRQARIHTPYVRFCSLGFHCHAICFKRMGEGREKENKRQNGEIREQRRQTNADLFLRELAISKETCKATIYYIDISRKQPIRKTWS